MHRANLIAHILGKTKETKRCFTIKINGLRKTFVSRFLFQLYYFTSPSHGAVYEDST